MKLWIPPDADLGEPEGPAPDPISAQFYLGHDDQDRPIPMSYRNLVTRTEQWPVTKATPEGPAELLKTAREMYVLGLYAYNLVASSCTWSIFAVEAALKLRLNKGKSTSLQDLIQLAEQEGILHPGMSDIMDTGREIRNKFVHEGKQKKWPFAVSTNVIGTSHLLVAELYPDTSA